MFQLLQSIVLINPHEFVELPPPGAYDIAKSFDVLKTKGRIENTGVLASKNKRELFTGKEFEFF